LASSSTTAPIGSALAGRYATALYALAEEQNELARTIEEMAALGRLIEASGPLRALLASPLVDLATASRAVADVLQRQGFGTIVRNFVGVVAANRRLPALAGFVAAFAALVAERRGVVVARVATAHPLTDAQRQQLRARLLETGLSQVEIVEQVDPSLLGGMVVAVGARLYDTSLKSRLQRLQHAMKGAA
jgi:F-type H+-transporting ATPase subunit delta